MQRVKSCLCCVSADPGRNDQGTTPQTGEWPPTSIGDGGVRRLGASTTKALPVAGIRVGEASHPGSVVRMPGDGRCLYHALGW